MKRTLITLLLIAILLSTASVHMEETGLNIVTLNFAAFDFSRQIAGERAEITLLLPPGVDAHSYEPSPRDLIALQNADLVVYNGGIGEQWVTALLANLGAQAPVSIAMMEVVDTVSEELMEGMEDVPHAHEDEHEDGHEDKDEHAAEEHGERELDEHVWTTPKNAIRISEAILEKLTEIDVEGRSVYEVNFDAFKAELMQLDQDFKDMFDSAKLHTIVLGDRFPMRYFTMEYNLDYFAAFPGCSAQSEPSARTIAFLMDTIKEQSIPAVFYTEFSSRKAAELIAAETGTAPLLLHSAHNVTTADMEAGITYLSIMRDNLINLKEALN